MVDHDESVNPNADFWNEFKSLHNETKMIDSTKVLPLPILSNMTNILTSSFHSMNNNSRCCIMIILVLMVITKIFIIISLTTVSITGFLLPTKKVLVTLKHLEKHLNRVPKYVTLHVCYVCSECMYVHTMTYRSS
jgi:hypothetical protein